MMCKVLEVSRSVFYDYLCACHRPDQDPEQAALKARVRAIFMESKQTYGSRRILKQLKSERFFRSLKSEHLAYCRFVSRSAAKREILEYITFYNAYRLHSTLGYMSPMEFEKSVEGRLAKDECPFLLDPYKAMRIGVPYAGGQYSTKFLKVEELSRLLMVML